MMVKEKKTYKCALCGAEYDDEKEAEAHEKCHYRLIHGFPIIPEYDKDYAIPTRLTVRLENDAGEALTREYVSKNVVIDTIEKILKSI